MRFIRIGDKFINAEQILNVSFFKDNSNQDRAVIEQGLGDEDCVHFVGAEARGLMKWLDERADQIIPEGPELDRK